MGIFDKVFGGSSGPIVLTAQESYLGILVSVVASDGEITDQEFDDINSASRKAKILHGLTGKQFTKAADKVFEILQKQGYEALLDLCAASLPADKREGVYTIAVDLAFSDGSIDDNEVYVVQMLRDKLGVESVVATNIENVIIKKNSV